MFRDWRLVAQRTQALVDDKGFPENVRLRAAATFDLLHLVATWPVPHRTGCHEELASLLYDLCEKSGQALCGGHYCPDGGMPGTGASCQGVLERTT